MLTPLSDDDRRAALERANEVRKLRQNYRFVLGRMTVADSISAVHDLLIEPPPWAETWRVEKVLCLIHNVGPATAKQMLGKAGIHTTRRLGGMTMRQRTDLSVLLEQREAHARQRESGSTQPLDVPAFIAGTPA